MFTNHYFNIIVVGVGGTGGNLVTRLCQFLAGVEKNRYCLTLIDGDTVSESNLVRQPFLQSDVGEYKAEVLASSLSDAYNLNVRYMNRYLNKSSDINECLASSNGLYSSRKTSYYCKSRVTVICGCVDNMHARKVMHDYFEEAKDVIYVDSGNEYSYGEVCFGIKKKGKVLSPDKIYYFPEMFDDADMTPKEEESCTELNNSSPQHLITNVLAANIILTALVDLFSEGVCPTGITHFDSFKMFMRQDEYVPPAEQLRMASVLKED